MRKAMDSLLEEAGKGGAQGFEWLVLGVIFVIISAVSFKIDAALFPYAHNVLFITTAFFAGLGGIAFLVGAAFMLAFTLLLLFCCFAIWILANAKNTLHRLTRK